MEEGIGFIVDIGTLQPGDVIAFRISPLPGPVSPNVGRWGALKVVHRKGDDFTVSVLAGLHDTCPDVAAVADAPPLMPVRFVRDPARPRRFNGARIFLVPRSRRMTLEDAQRIGSGAPLTPDETAARQATETEGHPGTLADWTQAAIELDHEDWARRDPAGWSEALARFRALKDEEIAAARAREADRLRGLTFELLLSETPFAGWDDRRDLLPDGFAPAARARMRAAQQALAALGPKPRRAPVRAELKALVDWFNGFGQQLDTMERDEIFQAIEELCWAAGQKPLVNEIGDWRDF